MHRYQHDTLDQDGDEKERVRDRRPPRIPASHVARCTCGWRATPIRYPPDVRWGDRYDTRPEDIERRNERTWYATHYTPILAATSAVVDEPADQQHIPSFGAAP